MEIPSQIGKYKVIKKLGQGASGCVLKAQQDVIHRIVALKILFTDLLQYKPTVVKRFKREARLASSLVHPNIVPIFDIGEDSGMHYYTMQFVEGIPMTDHISRNDLPLEKRLHIFIQFCDALALAHSRDIIHRDLKPHNVIIAQNFTPIILDFGIAKSLIDDEQMTQTGHILGSAHYMAPEQAKSEGVGTYTDVFGIGVMMYEMFTGQRPFKGTNVRDLIVARLEYGDNPDKHRPISIRKIRPDIPENLDRIIFKCLEASPEKRYRTAGELLKDLQTFRQELFLYKVIQAQDQTKNKFKKLVDKKTSFQYPLIFSLILLVVGLIVISWIYWGENIIPWLDQNLFWLRELKNLKPYEILDFLASLFK